MSVIPLEIVSGTDGPSGTDPVKPSESSDVPCSRFCTIIVFALALGGTVGMAFVAFGPKSPQAITPTPDTDSLWGDDFSSVLEDDDTVTPTQDEDNGPSSPTAAPTYTVNDDCLEAKTLPIGGSVVVATPGPLDHDYVPQCYDDTIVPSSGMWYRVSSPVGGFFEARLNNPYTTADTYVSAYRDISEDGYCIELDCVGDHSFDGHFGSVLWEAQASVNYRILVHHTTGQFGLKVFFHENDPRESDSEITVDETIVQNYACSQADEIEVDEGVVVGFTMYSSQEQVPSCQGYAVPSPGAWYSVYSDTEGKTLHASLDPVYTPFTTYLSVFEGGCGDLACVGAHTMLDGELGSVTWTTKADTYYMVVVHRTSDDFGLVIESVD